jgi:hypothetical protein
MPDPAHDGPETPRAQDHGTTPGQRQPGAASDGLLAVVKNPSQYHREHEKYYSEALVLPSSS